MRKRNSLRGQWAGDVHYFARLVCGELGASEFVFAIAELFLDHLVADDRVAPIALMSSKIETFEFLVTPRANRVNAAANLYNFEIIASANCAAFTSSYGVGRISPPDKNRPSELLALFSLEAKQVELSVQNFPIFPRDLDKEVSKVGSHSGASTRQRRCVIAPMGNSGVRKNSFYV